MDKAKTFTNRVEATFDYDAITARYDMYEIEIPHYKDKSEYGIFYESIKKHFSPKARAVWSSKGKGRLVLLVEKGKSVDKSGFDIKKTGLARMREMPVRVMLSMMLSIMAGRSSFFDLSDNPFEIYYPCETTPKRMIALQIQLKENEDGLFMNLGATNFMAVKEPSSRYPSYIYDHGVLRRYDNKADAKTDKTIYLKKGTGKTRTNVTFLYLNHRFKESKTYFFYRIAEDMKAYLSDLMDFRFVSEEVFVVSEGKDKSKQNRRLDETIKHYIGNIGRINIAILDPQCRQEGELLSRETESLLDGSSLGLFDSKVNISVSDRIDNSVPNISLTLSPSSYKDNGLSDPYKKINRTVPVQNYTAEANSTENTINKTLLQVILKELAIKCELYGYEPFVDHHEYSIDGLTFVSVENYLVKDASATYGKAFLKNGRIDAGELNEEEKNRVEFALTELPAGDYPEFVIWDKKGNIVLGTRTVMFPLPDFRALALNYEASMQPHYFTKEEVVRCADSVKQYTLKKHIELPAYADNLSLRDRFLAYLEEIDTVKGIEAEKLFSSLDKQQKLKTALESSAGRPLRFLPRGGDLKDTYSGLMGITYTEGELGTLYHVGIGRENTPDKIEKNSPYRRLVSVSGEINPLEVFPLLEVYFVKNKELTVLPYPVKYARERVFTA